MAIPANNPLFKHFRQPALYINLPSKGKFWPENLIDVPVSGDIPVFPMTVKDEITIKTPDALMNGSGVVDVIQSCCPNIKDAWRTPAIDLDTLLIAIRIASYGEILDIDTECPNCKTENTHAVDLRVVIDSLNTPDYDPVIIDDLKFQFKPQTFMDLNNNNLLQYEQQKLVNTITNSELSDERKVEEFQKIFPKLTELNVLAITNSIESITVGETVVVTEEHIKEFINNCDRKIYSEIKTEAERLASQAKIKPFDLQCVNCQHEYQSEVIFEQSNFFE